MDRDLETCRDRLETLHRILKSKEELKEVKMRTKNKKS